MGVRVLSQKDFNNDKQLKLIYSSYEKYLADMMKYSAFDIKKALAEQNAQETSDRIKNSVKGWALEKEVKKDEAEQEYYAALEQYNLMKSSQEKALSRLQYTTNVFGEDSTQYSDALKKYNLADKTLFSSNISLDCARDKFNAANVSAFKAYLSSME